MCVALVVSVLMPRLQFFTKVDEGFAQVGSSRHGGGGGRGALVEHNSPPLAVFTASLPTVGTLKAARTLFFLSFFFPAAA